MQECSWPLIYYTVNDFEDLGLHLSIEANQYLCVELAILIPNDTTPSEFMSNSFSSTTSSDPFPIPSGKKKLILFQGAVPYRSLLQVYLSKAHSKPEVQSPSVSSLISSNFLSTLSKLGFKVPSSLHHSESSKDCSGVACKHGSAANHACRGRRERLGMRMPLSLAVFTRISQRSG